jgi:hypothetical protein
MLPAVERGDPRGMKVAERKEIPNATVIIPTRYTSRDFVICNSDYANYDSLPGCLKELGYIKRDQNILYNLTNAKICDLFAKIESADSLYFMGHGIFNAKMKKYTILGSDTNNEFEGIPIPWHKFKRIYISACSANIFREAVTSETCKVYTSDLVGGKVSDDDLIFARMFVDGQLTDGLYATYYKFMKRIGEDRTVSYDGRSFSVSYISTAPTVTKVVKAMVVEIEKSPESKQSEKAKTKGIVEGHIQRLRKKLDVAEETARSQDIYTRRFSDSQSATREALTMAKRAKCDKIRAEIDAYIMKNHDILFGGP